MAMSSTLATQHPEVTVEGEVASVSPYKDSTLFFDLKEEGARLSCFIRNDLVPGVIEVGQRVRATGRPNVAKKNASLRLRANAVEFAGEGALQRAIEMLRRRLEAEGLFSATRKRALPQYPTAIGLITSLGCDGDMDFRTKLAQRWPLATVHLANVSVQGAGAPDEIAAALNYFNEGGLLLDLLVIVRGGGSAEDLQAFNTERVVRAIVASRVPVVNGVGHENDTTLADLAADLRAMTPTDAALQIAPNRNDIEKHLIEVRAELSTQMIARWQAIRNRLVRQASQMESMFMAPRERLLAIQSRVSHAMETRITASRERLAGHLNFVADRQRQQQTTATTRLETVASLVKALAPQSVLRRGFAIVRDKNGVVRSSQKLHSDDAIQIRFHDGTIDATVKEL
ncbi:MAG: exodeoxyribonuclease VII large subunit [Actinomycetota bacterium]